MTSQIQRQNSQALLGDLTDLVGSLLISVEQLKQNVSRLDAENALMANDIRTLRQHNGSKFYLFSKLPLELQRMIWKFAFKTPRIHLFDKELIYRSQASMLMQACKESREIGHELQMPFYFYSAKKPRYIQSPKYHINVDIDTVWVQRATTLPNFVHFRRAKNEAGYNPGLLWNSEIVWHNGLSDCSPKFRFNCLALDADQWEDPVVDQRERENIGSTDILMAFNSPRQLFIVLAKPPSFCPSKLVFVKPRLPPHLHGNRTVYRESLYSKENDMKVPSPNHTWEIAARRVENILTWFKAKRTDDRRREVEENGRTYQEIDRWENFMDLGDWVIPKVSYVEAVEYDRHWSQPIYSDLVQNQLPIDPKLLREFEFSRFMETMG